MPQFLRPNSDLVTNANWTATPYFEKLDEVSFDDADFVSCGNSNNAAFELGLSSAAIPQAGTRTLRVRCKKGASGGNQRGLDFILKQGETTVQSGTVEANLTEVYSTVAITISNSITNYSTLSLELASTGAVGGAGGNRRTVEVSWVEFEIPDQEPASYNESLLLDSSSLDAYLSQAIFVNAVALTSSAVDVYVGGLTLVEAISLTTSALDAYLFNNVFTESITLSVVGLDQSVASNLFVEALTLGTGVTVEPVSEVSTPNTLILRFKIKSS